MQPLKVSCVGQTFALARCSDSREKKTRRRRSKEERKTMVESFIKKYQTSNNGNFPSLNITHKEVGGSFYTVREIVREIIQENKVLGPGNLTLKALNLENCLEEHTGGSFSTYPHEIDRKYMESYSPSSEHQIISEESLTLNALDLESRLEEHTGGSFSMYSHEIDTKYVESYSLSSGHQVISEESYEVANSETMETFASHPNDCHVSQIVHDKSSDHLDQNSSATYLDESSVNIVYEEANLRQSTDVNSEANEVIYTEGQSHSSNDCNRHQVEQTVALLNSASVTYPSNEVGVNESEIGSKSNSTAGTANSFSENSAISDITRANILPDTKILSNSVNNNMPASFQEYSASNAREVFPLASSATKISSSDRRPLEAEHYTSSLEVSGTLDLSNEVGVESVLVDKEPTEVHSSCSINEAPEAKMMSPLSRTFGTTKVEPQLVLQPSDIDNIVMSTDSAVCESLSPDVKGTPGDTFKADIAGNCDRASISSSVSSKKANEEFEKEEINPVWAAVKAFVTAVIKFWTE